MGKLIFLLGAQGSGKTTVAKRALDSVKDKYEIINFGDILQEIIGSDRDKFRRETKYSDFQTVQKKTAQKIADMLENKNIIVTSHGVLYRESGFMPGFPKWVLDILKPGMIVIIWSKPRDIVKRKQKDEKAGVSLERTRDKFGLDAVFKEQEYSKQISFAYSMYCGACVKIIENPEGHPDRAAKELATAINNL
jgi:adenylate kinase